jgi:hypothetical protein
MSVLKPSKVDMNQILFREAKKVVDKDNKKIGLRIPIYYGTQQNMQKFLVQTPKMKVPFGLSSFEGSNFMIGPQFTGFRENFDNNKDAEQIFVFMEKLTSRIVKEIKKNIVDWFGKGYAKFDDDQIKTALMWPVVKFSEENKYDPTMKVKFPSFRDKSSGNLNFTTKVFNKERELVEINAEFPAETIPKFSDVKLIMHFSDLFVGSSKASLTIKAEQVMVYPPESFLRDCAFLDDEDVNEDEGTTKELSNAFDEESSEDEEEEEEEESEEVQEESEEEESEEEEEEPEPEPTPPSKLTRGRKKLKKPE